MVVNGFNVVGAVVNIDAVFISQPDEDALTVGELASLGDYARSRNAGDIFVAKKLEAPHLYRSFKPRLSAYPWLL